jgi:hypothetical protein
MVFNQTEATHPDDQVFRLADHQNSFIIFPTRPIMEMAENVMAKVNMRILSA